MKKTLTLFISLALIVGLLPTSLLAKESVSDSRNGTIEIQPTTSLLAKESVIDSGNETIEIQPMVILPPGNPGFTWDKIETRYYSNVSTNYVTNNMAPSIVAGLVYMGLESFTPAKFIRGVAGYHANRIADKMTPNSKNKWMKQVRYIDRDSVNVYVKVVTYVYSNSSRTKLDYTIETIDKYRR